MDSRNILILGGYGNFGKRIVESLLDLTAVKLIIAGRSLEKASNLCRVCARQDPAALLEPAVLDINDVLFEEQLRKLNPFLIIHTGGPFQGQDYRVPQACINIGCHYIDLADDRRFVCDIGQLNAAAKEKGVLVVTGASSVPGLSATVVDHYVSKFQTLETIDYAIAPGNKAERGEATVRAILSYTGHPFQVFRSNSWVDVVGWGDVTQRDFGGRIGKRWLANVDIPDLELFPVRYPSVKNVHFQAGLELPVLHFGMSLMAKLVRLKFVNNWSPLAKWIVKASELFLPFGTDSGAMQVSLKGTNSEGHNLEVNWTLYAHNGVGPYIPTLSAIILARKLMADTLDQTGAMACQGMYTLDEFDQVARPWGIYSTETISYSKQRGC